MIEIECECGKVTYTTMSSARYAGVLCRTQDGGDKLRPYYCPLCGYYHLTSHPSGENHEIYKNGHKYNRNKNKYRMDETIINRRWKEKVKHEQEKAYIVKLFVSENRI